MTQELQLKIQKLPESPGCYIMKQEGHIIYVGKAINLKNRVRSYFQSSRNHTVKVAAMVEKIDDFDIFLCESNLEALVLECNLIKLHRPYYNILLKDDKHYPYIRIDLNEPFARISLSRSIEKDGAKYFGPYIGATAIKQVMETIRHIFPLRSCQLLLPLKKPKRPCVNYEIGRCLAPCAAQCNQETYSELIKGVIQFLNGKYQDVVRMLEQDMMKASQSLQFEKAALMRDRIKDVNDLMQQQNAIQTNETEQDIIGIAQDGLDALVQVLFVRGGKMIGGEYYVLPREGAEDEKEVLAGFITQFYQDGHLIPRYVLCHALPENTETLEQWLRNTRGQAVTLSVPKRGEKHELIKMANKNASDALEKRNAKAAIQRERTIGACEALGKAIGMTRYPRRIEGYDISNTQGVLSVASMVVFIDGVPAKKEYRHFRIKTVEGANDFASHKEVVGRRLKHGLAEIEALQAEGAELESGKFSDLPDLILIDGGPQQLRFAQEAMKENGLNIPMFGLAKRIEEVFLPNREEPILLDHHTPELHLIQRIRDEAHRFGITYHRALRGKASIHSQLDDIPGIGEKRRKALLLHFHSLKAIKEADFEALMQVKGINIPAANAILKWSGKNMAQINKEAADKGEEEHE